MRKILRRSDLKQPQLPETRLKIDFDRFFRFISVRNFIENRYILYIPIEFPGMAPEWSPRALETTIRREIQKLSS